MSASVKCPQCGLVNFGSQPVCRRCQSPFDAPPNEYGADPAIEFGAPVSRPGPFVDYSASRSSGPPLAYGTPPPFDPAMLSPYGAPQTSPYGNAFGEAVPGAIAGGVWREGHRLLFYKHARLPDRCFKCNSPAHGRQLARNLTWHSPWLYALIIPGILFYVIVAPIVQKRARVRVGICERHAAYRRNTIVVGWVFFFIGSISLVVAVGEKYPLAALAGLFMLFASLIVWVVVNQFVVPARISDDYVWIKNAGSEFLASLPPIVGSSHIR